MSEPRQRTAQVVAVAMTREEREWLQRHSSGDCAVTDLSSMGVVGRTYTCRCGSRWPIVPADGTERT